MNRTSLLGLSLVACVLVWNAAAAQAATKTWSGTFSNDWDTSTQNWNSGNAVFVNNADTASFGNHGKGSKQTINIVGNISPAAITMHYWGGNNGAYEFSGGDLTGPGTFTMTSDGVLRLPKSFSFSGGSTLSHTSANLILEPATSGTYHFGTGVIKLDASWKVGSGQFNFNPGASATNDNDFQVVNGGGSISGNANANWDSNVDLQAVVGLSGNNIWSGMTFNLSNNNGGIEFYRTGSSGALPRFNGNVQGAGFDFTFGDGITSGTPTDYEIVLDTGSTFNVRNLILDSQATIIVVEGTDSQTVFDDVNGKIVVQGNTVLATEGGDARNFPTLNGTYYIENDYELHSGNFTRIVANNILVQDGGSVSGDGLLQAHTTGVTVNDGTLAPGFSIGTLEVDGNLILTSAANMEFELGAPGDSDLIAVDGNLVLDGTATLSLLEGLELDTLHNYTLFTYTGVLSGSNLNFVTPDGVLAFLDLSTNGVVGVNILLTVPEPSSLSLLLLGAVGLCIRRKKRSA